MRWRGSLRRKLKFTHLCSVCQARGYVAPHPGQHAVIAPPLPPAVKPRGGTRPGDLRYNIMVRLGNMGCPHDVDGLTTEELRAHWRSDLEANNRG